MLCVQYANDIFIAGNMVEIYCKYEIYLKYIA